MGTVTLSVWPRYSIENSFSSFNSFRFAFIWRTEAAYNIEGLPKIMVLLPSSLLAGLLFSMPLFWDIDFHGIWECTTAYYAPENNWLNFRRWWLWLEVNIRVMASALWRKYLLHRVLCYLYIRQLSGSSSELSGQSVSPSHSQKL